MPETQSDFQPISSPKDIRAYFREATQTSASLLLWIKGEETRVHGTISVVSEEDSVFYVWSPQGKSLARTRPSECLLSLSLSGAHLFFSASYQGYDEAGLRFTLPQKVFKVQRRKNYRFRVPEGHVLKLRFLREKDGMIGNTRVFDLSVGGFSFEIPAEDKELYPSGSVLKGVEFTAAGHKFGLDGTVRHVAKATSPKGKETGMLRVGVQFNSVPAKDEALLASYIFEESRKHYLKFLE